MSEIAPTRAERLARWVAGLPRLVRILYTGFVALLGAAAVSIFFNLLAGEAVFADAATARTGFFLALGAGAALYAWGWAALLGFSGRDHAFEIGRGGVFFVLIGLVLLAMVIVWGAISIVVVSLPPEVPL